ncbi:MAG: prepilin-type N-terminal cleavage/methylation domain-containing protein [Pirellulales bacterium]
MNRRIASAARRRSGISLIEVLMSIFILAVGLLGIASLLPLGQRQIEEAEQHDRAAIIGQNAFRTFRTRGYSNYQWWCSPSGTSVAQNTSPFAQPVLTTPIIIDPLLASNTALTATANVPHSGTLLKRFTVKQTPGNSGGAAINAAAAEAVFVARDDLILTQGNTPEDSSSLKLDNNARRDFEGRYSWMAMISPANPGTTTPGLPVGTPHYEMPCELSIIVFNRRPYLGNGTNVLNDEETIGGMSIPRERVVDADLSAGGGIGGGDAVLSGGTNAYHLMVRPGEYLLLVSTNGRNARWYKILSAEDYNPASDTQRTITLAGPDWTYGAAKAIIFDGATAVYTKSIKLEGPSRMN